MNTKSDNTPESMGSTPPATAIFPAAVLLVGAARVMGKPLDYVAPLIVAAVDLFGSLVGSFHLPDRRRLAMLLDPAHRRAAIECRTYRCNDYHPDSIRHRRLLLSRCACTANVGNEASFFGSRFRFRISRPSSRRPPFRW